MRKAMVAALQQLLPSLETIRTREPVFMCEPENTVLAGNDLFCIYKYFIIKTFIKQPRPLSCKCKVCIHNMYELPASRNGRHFFLKI